jgi:hypothetical protein
MVDLSATDPLAPSMEQRVLAPQRGVPAGTQSLGLNDAVATLTSAVSNLLETKSRVQSRVDEISGPIPSGKSVVGGGNAPDATSVVNQIVSLTGLVQCSADAINIAINRL